MIWLVLLETPNFARDLEFVMGVLRVGTAKGRVTTEQTKEDVMEGVGLFKLG